MKAGANKTDQVKIRKLKAAGREAEEISSVLGITVKVVKIFMEYNPKAAKEAANAKADKEAKEAEEANAKAAKEAKEAEAAKIAAAKEAKEAEAAKIAAAKETKEAEAAKIAAAKIK